MIGSLIFEAICIHAQRPRFFISPSIMPEFGMIMLQFGMIILESGTMSTNALFSAALQKILALLFVRVDEAFYLNEIIRLTGLGSASAQRELKQLELDGLIRSERVGNMRRFQANPASPIYPELHGMIQKTFGLTGVLRDALAPLAGKVQLAFVYGSMAKGNATANSDIDLLLVAEQLSYGTLLAALAPAEEKLGRKINPTPYTTAEYIKRYQEQQHFLMRVLEQPKLFLMGDENDLRRLGESGESGEHSQVEGRAIEPTGV